MDTLVTKTLQEHLSSHCASLLAETAKRYHDNMLNSPTIVRLARYGIGSMIEEEYACSDKAEAFIIFAIDWVIKQYLANTAYVDNVYTLQRFKSTPIADEALSEVYAEMLRVYIRKVELADYLLTLDKGFGYTMLLGSKDLCAYLTNSMSKHVARISLCELQFYMKEMQSTWVDLDVEEKENIIYAK